LTQPRAEAVVLDMDGLLIDTEPVWRAAQSAVFAGFGVTLSASDLLDSTGQPIEELIPIWRQRRPPGSGPGPDVAGRPGRGGSPAAGRAGTRLTAVPPGMRTILPDPYRLLPDVISMTLSATPVLC